MVLQVSVIIPVYRAERFLESAVRSALEQEETGEVILVEDGSSDGSLQICERLAGENERVALLRHPGGENRGAGASRNLGLEAAGCDYIAFLDADDRYLPGRFGSARAVFAAEPSADGVYDAVGAACHDEDAAARFRQRWKLAAGEEETHLTTLRGEVAPEDLFHTLVAYDRGYFHLDGVVFKRALLRRAGRFPEELKLCQDTFFLTRLAYYGRLYPGSLDRAVAVRGVHDGNRVSADLDRFRYYKSRYAELLFLWALGERVERRTFRLILRQYLLCRGNRYYHDLPGWTRRSHYLWNALSIFARHPGALVKAVA